MVEIKIIILSDLVLKIGRGNTSDMCILKVWMVKEPKWK